MCSSLHPFYRYKRSNQSTEKALEPHGGIWRMLNMLDKWRSSCTHPRAPSLWGTWSYEAAHTRLCLLSLWHGKTANTRERREGKSEDERVGHDRNGWVGGWRGKMKGSTKTELWNKIIITGGYCRNITNTGGFKHPAGPPTHRQYYRCLSVVSLWTVMSISHHIHSNLLAHDCSG